VGVALALPAEIFRVRLRGGGAECRLAEGEQSVEIGRGVGGDALGERRGVARGSERRRARPAGTVGHGTSIHARWSSWCGRHRKPQWECGLQVVIVTGCASSRGACRLSCALRNANCELPRASAKAGEEPDPQEETCRSSEALAEARGSSQFAFTFSVL